MPADARDVAHRVLRRVATQNAFATLALGTALAESGLPPREKRLATELVYGVCRYQMRLDRALAALTPRGIHKLNPGILAILRVGAYELLFLRTPDHAAVSNAVRATRRLAGPRLAGFVNGVLRRLAREGEPALPPRSDARAHVEVACSLPRWIVDRLAAELGDDPDGLEAAAAALNGPAPLVLRANALRCDRATLAERLRAEHPDATVDPSPWAPHALITTGLGDPEQSPSFAEGLWTVQDVGAQIVGDMAVSRAGAAPGLRVLDACAGVGGKSTHLAELTGDQARIDAADVSESKLGLLARSAARLGIGGVTPRHVDLTAAAGAAWTAAGLAESYDVVLLDAPCTGLGVLRRHPEAKARLRAEDVGRMAVLQARLLDAVVPHVGPGGVLVYSVCTFTREEGPAQVEAFMARHPGFALEAPPMTGEGAPPWSALGPAPGIARTWPHRHEADAFFMARLRRQ